MIVNRLNFVKAIPKDEGSNVHFNFYPYILITEKFVNQFDFIENFIVRHVAEERIPTYNIFVKNNDVNFFTDEIMINANPEKIFVEHKSNNYRFNMNENFTISNDDFEFRVSNNCFYAKDQLFDTIVFFYNPNRSKVERFKVSKLDNYLFSIYEDFSYNLLTHKFFLRRDSRCEFYVKNREDLALFHMNYLDFSEDDQQGFKTQKIIKTSYNPYDIIYNINVNIKKSYINGIIFLNLTINLVVKEDIIDITITNNLNRRIEDFNTVKKINAQNDFLQEINNVIESSYEEFIN